MNQPGDHHNASAATPGLWSSVWKVSWTPEVHFKAVADRLLKGRWWHAILVGALASLLLSVGLPAISGAVQPWSTAIIIVDTLLSVPGRLLIMALVIHTALRILVGRRLCFRRTMTATFDSSLVWLWSPVAMLLSALMAAAIARLVSPLAPTFYLLYVATKAIVLSQGLFWVWTCWRVVTGLQVLHGVSRQDARVCALCPVWGFLIVAWIDPILL